MHSPKHHCLGLGARLNKKEKANQYSSFSASWLWMQCGQLPWARPQRSCSPAALMSPPHQLYPGAVNPDRIFLLSVAFARTTRQVINTEITQKTRARHFLSMSEVWTLKWYPVVKEVLLNYLNKEIRWKNRYPSYTEQRNCSTPSAMKLVYIIRIKKHFRHSQESELCQWSLRTDTVVRNFSGLPWTLKKITSPSHPQPPMASHRTTDSRFSREGHESCPKAQMTECAMGVTKGGEPVSSLLGARPSTRAVSANAGTSQQFWC